MCSSSFASSRSPSVPVSEISNASPQRRPARSSTITVHSGFSTAHDSAADSPSPSSQDATSDPTEIARRAYCERCSRSQERAGLFWGPSLTSCSTDFGIRSSSGRRRRRSARPAFAKRMTGDASQTHFRLLIGESECSVATPRALGPHAHPLRPRRDGSGWHSPRSAQERQ
jgi:hypothetical protein